MKSTHSLTRLLAVGIIAATASVGHSDLAIKAAHAATSNAPVVSLAATPDGKGYWEAASDGGIFAFGDAGFYGSMGGKTLSAPVVGIATTPTGYGYWEVASDGGIFAFGDAGFYGSMGGKTLSAPVVGITGTPDGKGYWEVAKDGGVFSFGDAQYYGSMGGKTLSASVVALAPTADGHGYTEVAGDGGIFAFGNAPFYGSMGGQHLNAPVVGMARTATGAGYWETASDGGIFAFGDAGFYGSMGGKTLNAPVVSIAATPSGKGYWEVASDGGIFSFGDAQYYGSVSHTQPVIQPNDLRSTIVQRAKTENAKNIVETPAGSNCNPYTAFWSRGSATGCTPGTRTEAWCADFASYVWHVAGADVSGLSGTASSFYTYGKNNGTLKSSNPQPGDAVVFGWSNNVKHVGIVITVNNAISVTMISGNWTDAVKSYTFNPTSSNVGGDGPVLGYVSPR